jgi:hypothetical protein
MAAFRCMMLNDLASAGFRVTAHHVTEALRQVGEE